MQPANLIGAANWQKPPPSNTEAEQALLGALLIANHGWATVAEFLKPEHFANGVHARIYAAIGALIEGGRPADPISLKVIFDQDEALVEIGGARYLAQLVESAVTIVNVPHYGRTIFELSRLRNFISVLDTSREAAFSSITDPAIGDVIDGHYSRLDAELARRPAIKPTPFVWVDDPSALPPREFLYGRHLARGFASATIAPGGSGKSALAVAEALAMASGQALLGEAAAGRLRVWLLNLEDPLDELRRRAAASALHYRLDKEDLADRLFIDSGRELGLVLARDGRDGIEIAEAVVRSLKREIAKRSIDVVIVDPFVASHTVPENDNTKIAAVARLWAGIADEAGCAIELIHHARKVAPGQPLAAEDARGASALINAVRSARVLNSMSKEDAERAGIDNPRLYFSVMSGKANLAPPPDKAMWRRLVNVALGNGDEVGVAAPWSWPDPFAEVSVGDAQEVQRRIAAGEWRADHRSKNWAGIAIAEVLDLDLGDRAAAAAVRDLLKGWLRTGALRVVTRKDGKRMDKQFIVVGQWLG